MRIFLTFFLSILYALMVGFSVANFPFFVGVGMALVPALALLIANRYLFLFLPFLAMNTQLYVPGIPGNFQLFHVLCAFFCVHSLLTGALRKEFSTKRFYLDMFIVMFIMLWVVALMGFRGTGMRVLGSSEVGGGTYLQILIVLGFYLFSRNENPSLETIRVYGTLMGCVCLMPVLAQGLYELSGGRIWYQMLFFRFGAAQGETTASIAQGNLSRFTFLSHGAHLIWVGVFIGTKTKQGFLLRWIFWGFALICAIMSGYRATTLTTVFFLYLFCLTQSHRRIRFLGVSVASACAFYVLLMMVSTELPFAAQRILSSLPGMEVSWEARRHAAGTLLWRKEVWSLALGDLPKYWLFGRGLTFNPAMLPIMEFHFNTPYIAYTTGAFHQATLELLILFGGPAFLATALFYLSVLLKGRGLLSPQNWENPEIHSWAVALFVYLVVRIGLGFLGGAVGELLIQLPMFAVLFQIICTSGVKDEDWRCSA